MEKNIYPVRSFIRFQAKKQLLTAASEDLQASLSSAQSLPSQDASSDTWHNDPREIQGALCLNSEFVDDGLLKEITATLFNSDRYPELYRPCKDTLEATAIEEAIAAEIVLTYAQIKHNEQNPAVQGLNNLL